MSGKLTTHVLDTARGCPAVGMQIELTRIEDGLETMIAEVVTNTDGRTDAPMLQGEAFSIGVYQLTFRAGGYLRASQPNLAHKDGPLFLDDIPIRFGIAQAEAHYHVPLLISPYAFSTYRGS